MSSDRRWCQLNSRQKKKTKADALWERTSIQRRWLLPGSEPDASMRTYTSYASKRTSDLKDADASKRTYGCWCLERGLQMLMPRMRTYQWLCHREKERDGETKCEECRVSEKKKERNEEYKKTWEKSVKEMIWRSTGWPAFTDADAFKKGLTIRTNKVAIVGSWIR